MPSNCRMLNFQWGMNDENHRAIMTLNSLNQNAEKLFSRFLSLTASLSSLEGYEKGRRRGIARVRKKSVEGRGKRITNSKLLWRGEQPPGYVKLRHSFMADLRIL